MKDALDMMEHGYFAQSYVTFEQSLEAHEFVFAVEMFGGLLQKSRYEFEVEHEEVAIDSEDDWLISDDEVYLQIPIPQAVHNQVQALELWYFALDEITEQRMQNIRLEQGVSTSHVVATADEDGVITDRIEEGSEHHLNLPISRLTKDKKERLKIGGVEVGDEDDDGVIHFGNAEYVLDIEAPEEADSFNEMENPLTSKLEVEDD